MRQRSRPHLMCRQSGMLLPLLPLLLAGGDPRVPNRRATEPLDSTQVIMLGTGMPFPDPKAQGPATAITVGDRIFLFDAGPGVERQMTAAGLPVRGQVLAFAPVAPVFRTGMTAMTTATEEYWQQAPDRSIILRDRLPIVTRLADVNGWVAGGFSGNGMSLGLIVGRMLADVAAGHLADPRLSMFISDRFTGAPA